MTAPTYILSLNGGMEEPFYQGFRDESTAREAYEKATKEYLNMVGDRVDLLLVHDHKVITLDTMDHADKDSAS